MNIQNLRSTYPRLIEYLQESGYSRSYITNLQREINFVLANADANKWESYRDVYDHHAKQTNSAQYLRYKLTFLGIIERYDLRGEFPDGHSRQRVVERGKYQFLSPGFRQIVDTYRAFEAQRGRKKSTTIYGESSNAAGFLYEQQLMGINSAEQISQASILSVFLDEYGNLRRSCSYKKILVAVFKANIPTDPNIFSRILAYLPDLRETRKNIQYLTSEEISEIKRVLADPESKLSLRDKAIGKMVLVYGLRSCDVAGLMVNDVDLHRERISIRQQKTDVFLELPLTTAPGNAIYDYVTAERPESDCQFVFLSANRPYRRLTNGSLGNIAAKIMKTAGIRQNAGDRKGFHIFRHRLATDLLANGVAQPIISRIAGHTSPDSLESYLSADFKHLKECAIDISRYPLSSEVFANA
jgi:integrase